MSHTKSERTLLLEHFSEDTPVIVMRGAGCYPDWQCTARLGDLMESLIPEYAKGYENSDAEVGLVIVAPIGMNLPGRLLDIVQLDGSRNLTELGLAAFARARTGVPPDRTDAEDALRHDDLVSRLVFHPEV